MDRPVDSERHRVAKLLDGLRWAERQDHRLASVRLNQPDGLFDTALLVRAHGEPEVTRLQGLPVTCEDHPPSGERHTLGADQNPERHERMRWFSGSKTGVGPATATVTGYSSPMYSTARPAPGTACSGGR